MKTILMCMLVVRLQTKWNSVCVVHVSICFQIILSFDIDLLHKSHNAPVPYPKIHHSVVTGFLLQNGAIWGVCLMHNGICEMVLL